MTTEERDEKGVQEETSVLKGRAPGMDCQVQPWLSTSFVALGKLPASPCSSLLCTQGTGMELALPCGCEESVNWLV